MKAYHPSNKAPVLGVVLLLVYSVIGGIAIGALLFAVAHLLYLVILFPAVVGGICGAIVTAGVKRGKVRNPFLAVCFAVLIGLLAYGSYRYFNYLEFRAALRPTISDRVQQELGRTDAQIVDQVIDHLLIAESGLSGFGGYLIITAREGVSIGRIGGPGENIGEVVTWIYWLTEVVISVAIAIYIVRPAARRLFCESHDRWYNASQHLGGVDPGDGPELLNLLEHGDYAGAGEMLRTTSTSPSLEMYIEQCADCLVSDKNMSIDRLDFNARGQVFRRTLLQRMISMAEFSALMDGLNAHPAADDA